MSRPNCTTVVPGANGPADDDSFAGDRRLRRRTLEQPRARPRDAGSSNTIGFAGLHRYPARHSRSRRVLKTLSASSPISKTKRDRSPSTTVPGLRGTCSLLAIAIRLLLHLRIRRDQRDANSADSRDGELLRLELLAARPSSTL